MRKRKSGIGSRLLHLFLSLILVTGIGFPMSLPVSALEGNCGSSTKWELNNGVLTLSGSGAVTIVGWGAYSNEVTSVVIGDGITSLTSSMFVNNKSLKSIVFGKSITTIPSSFCANCSALSSVQFADGLQTIGKKAFMNCVSLKALNLPSTVTEIDAQAFFSCVGLYSLTLPDSVTTIGDEAFKGNNVKTLKLGKNVKTIGTEAFRYSCFSEVEIPDTVTSIGANAFSLVYSAVSRSGSTLNYYYTGSPVYVTIIGKEGGTAQQYANAGGFPFRTPGSSAHTHSWSDWTVKKAAGCETAGEKIRTCSGCQQSESQTIPATGHSWSDWKTESAADCETDGVSARSCANCGKKETKTIPATGHSWSDWKTESAADCETDGVSARSCANCGKKETNTIPATGHNWGEWIVTKQPTVDATGEQESVCANCGKKRTGSVAALVGYSVSVSVSEGGSVTPSGEIKVAEGGSITLKITANPDWKLASVFVNGSEMHPNSTNEILLSDIRSNQNVSVVFQKIEQPKERKCNFIDVTPKRTVWLTDESGISMQDFAISANVTDQGMVSWLDVTADCVPDMTGMPSSEPYGSGTVRFRYQGSDTAVQEYMQQNSISVQIPLYLRGDGDGSCEVDVIDAELALQSYVVRLTGSVNDGLSEVQRTVLDVDGNGETVLEDAVYILKYYTQSFVGLTPDWDKIFV